ncbi:beta-barrel assembly-enhancing protease [mine drainage metagenome]|uniref:Beta-barrel assembly-enhancing protease n=1 Tax=mine drainage metagenome TaxID=410659 RepID=A0A1J5T3S2_9ZZZZ
MSSAARPLTRLALAFALAMPLAAAAQSAPVEVEKPAEKLPKLALTPQILYQMLLAEIADGRGDYHLAAGAYADLARSTRDPRIVRRAAEIAVYAREPEIALEMTKFLVQIDPESPQARQMLVGLLLATQRFDEATIHLAKLLALEGDHVGGALLRLNHLLARYPDKAAVERLVERLTQPYEQLPEAHVARAQAAENAGDDARALVEIGRAQKLRPDWQPAVLFEAQILQKGNHAKALEFLHGYLDAHPKASQVRLAYARALVGEKHFAQARREYSALLEANKDDQEAVYAVALLSLQLNDLAAAESGFKRLLDLGFGEANVARYYLGQIAEQGKHPEEALGWYGKVTPGEQYLAANVRAAELLARQGKLEAGRKSLQQAAVADPSERLPLLIAESQLLNDAGRTADAFDLLDGALAAQPEQPELLYETALLADKLGRFDVLERNLRKLIKLQPDHAQAYNALGYSFAERDLHLDEAQRLIDKALALSPDDAFILDSKGWVLYRRGDNNGALGYLQKAYSQRPDPEIAAHLGEVLWRLGRHDEAEKTWNDAIRAHPGNEALAATIKKFKP